MTNKPITFDDIDRAIQAAKTATVHHGEFTYADLDEALGLRTTTHQETGDTRMLSAFQEAGFDEHDAARGVRMMSSGRYFAFEDAAVALREHAANAGSISEARISRAAAALTGRKSSR